MDGKPVAPRPGDAGAGARIEHALSPGRVRVEIASAGGALAAMTTPVFVTASR